MAPADLVLHQSDDGRIRAQRSGGPRGAVTGSSAADDRLDAHLFGRDRELQRPEQISPVGQRHRRHAGFAGELAEAIGLDRAFQQRLGRPGAEMDKALAEARQTSLPSPADSAGETRHLADHPNEPRHRGKGQTFACEPNHGDNSILFVLGLFQTRLFPFCSDIVKWATLHFAKKRGISDMTSRLTD
jgi:hypothetical protein